jgi:hypothetical protein
MTSEMKNIPLDPLFTPQYIRRRIVTRIAPFVFPLSTTMRIESQSSTGGRSVIRSMEQLANGQVDLAPFIGINAGFDGFLDIFHILGHSS